MSVQDLYEQKDRFFIKTSQTVRGGIFVAIALGVITFILGMSNGEYTRTWGSLLFNVLFFFSIALGGIAFSAMQDSINAVWGRAIMRVQEAFAAFLLPSTIILLVFFVCIKLNLLHADEVYVWIADPSILDHFWGKKTWLQEDSMLIRDAVALLIILFLARWQMKKKLTPDRALLAGNKEKAKEEGLKSKESLHYWSAPILVVYTFAFTLLGFDLTMSLAPTWFSTLWGGWAFSIMMQTLMALLLICMYLLKNTALGAYIKKAHFHDVGKMMHGFTIFYAYLTYAHVLTYWYGNVPEETEYFLHRLHQPWLAIVLISPILSFILPLFALIPKASKWTASFAIPIAALILIAQWFNYLLIVQPQVMKAQDFNGWIELGIFFGVFGLFMASFFGFAKANPMLPIADPLLVESEDF